MSLVFVCLFGWFVGCLFVSVFVSVVVSVFASVSVCPCLFMCGMCPRFAATPFRGHD